MAFDEKLASRVREIIKKSGHPFTEKKMFGGLCFMVNEKMCVGVESERLMLRLDPSIYEDVLKKPGVSPMDFTGKVMKGYLFVDKRSVTAAQKLDYWLQLALQFNRIAKASKKSKAK
jgi:TfoX/Sxy family transcriptional regulator of competence genes